MPVRKTPRGFNMYAEFAQRNYPGANTYIYTVQESSYAGERKVWIGPDGDRSHLSESEARLVRDALSEFLGESEAATDVEPKTAEQLVAAAVQANADREAHKHRALFAAACSPHEAPSD